ncbi:MAG: hypothetical protein Q8S73_28460 [Deltaproteobacteria bacterium]|nr:hypothetical protein [Myxococcales bacterium]MDP3218072.1 hypothetical protein [Deltaproteobacteria bacterium]
MRQRPKGWRSWAGYGVATAAIACGVWSWLGATATWRPIDEATAERGLRGLPWARPHFVYSAAQSNDTNHSRSRTESGSFGNLRIEREDGSSEMTESSYGREIVEYPGRPPVYCDASDFHQPPSTPFVSHLVFRAGPGRRMIQFRCSIDRGPCLDELHRGTSRPPCAATLRVLSLAADPGARWPWVFGRLRSPPGLVAEDRVTLPKLRLAALALALAAAIELLALARTLGPLARRRPLPVDPPPYRGSALADPAPDGAPRWHRWHWLGASAMAALAAWLIHSVA